MTTTTLPVLATPTRLNRPAPSQPQQRQYRTRAVAASVEHRPPTKSDMEQTIPALHSSLSIGLVAFFGGALPGTILLARNWWRLGNKPDAVMLVITIVALQAFLMTIYHLLGLVMAFLLSPIVFTVLAVGIYVIAKISCGEQLRKIKQGYGRFIPWWQALAVAVCTTVGMYLIATCVIVGLTLTNIIA